MSATWVEVRERSENFGPVRNVNPDFQQYRCSAPLVELSGQRELALMWAHNMPVDSRYTVYVYDEMNTWNSCIWTADSNNFSISFDTDQVPLVTAGIIYTETFPVMFPATVPQ